MNAWLGDKAPDPGARTEELRRAAARYLLEAKREDGFPFDPVARFHPGNGALVHDIHAGADPSETLLARASGVMVNYRYDLAQIPGNHERFAAEQAVAASPAVRSLARPGRGEKQRGSVTHGQSTV